MKLRNKISGEIKEFALFDGNELQGGATLESLTKEWEDYEDTKDHWCLSFYGEPKRIGEYANSEDIVQCKQIGNYFGTEEEAEEAVEKLKAWKRLKDKGFRFVGWTIDDGLKISIRTNFEGDNIYSESEKEIRTNLDLLFSQEDD